MLGTRMASHTPDIERLLLDKARGSSLKFRLFILAASLLARYGDYVAKHRLARMIWDELESEHRPALGLLLEWARENGQANGSRFNQAIEACEQPIDAWPLFDVERNSEAFAKLAERRASAL